MLQGAGSGPYRRRLRYDRDFFFELSVCAEYHLPHSQFLDWDPDDQAKAIAFSIEKSLRCTMCGTAGWEWNPDDGGNRHAYDAVESFCHGCYAKAAAHSHDPNRNTDGITIELLPTGTAQHARRLIKQRARSGESE